MNLHNALELVETNLEIPLCTNIKVHCFCMKVKSNTLRSLKCVVRVHWIGLDYFCYTFIMRKQISEVQSLQMIFLHLIVTLKIQLYSNYKHVLLFQNALTTTTTWELILRTGRLLPEPATWECVMPAELKTPPGSSNTSKQKVQNLVNWAECHRLMNDT